MHSVSPTSRCGFPSPSEITLASPKSASPTQNRNAAHQANTPALPVVDSVADKKELKRKSILGRDRALLHFRREKSADFRYTDRPLKGLNLELFKETMSECLAKVQSAQTWKEKADSVKDIQRHLHGAEGKLGELNPRDVQVLANVVDDLLQSIVTQLKSQSQLLAKEKGRTSGRQMVFTIGAVAQQRFAKEKSRTLGTQTVSTLRAVAQQLNGLNMDLATKVDPLNLLEFEETKFRDRMSIANPEKSWEDKRSDILAVKKMLDGLEPAISLRLQIAPTTREIVPASMLIAARKLEIASLLDGLLMAIREEQEQMQLPESASLEEAKQVKALQDEVAKQLNGYIMKCWPLGLFKPVLTFSDNPDFESDLNSFNRTVQECLYPIGEGAGSASKRIRHLNYLQSELAELTDEHVSDLFIEEKGPFAELIDGLRENVAERCRELENRQVSQSMEEIQAADEDNVEKELFALEGVEDELDRLADLCRPPSTPEPVATESKERPKLPSMPSIPEDRPL